MQSLLDNPEIVQQVGGEMLCVCGFIDICLISIWKVALPSISLCGYYNCKSNIGLRKSLPDLFAHRPALLADDDVESRDQGAHG